MSRKKVSISTYLEPEQMEQLSRLRELTRVPTANIFREAIAFALQLYAPVLDGRMDPTEFLIKNAETPFFSKKAGGSSCVNCAEIIRALEKGRCCDCHPHSREVECGLDCRDGCALRRVEEIALAIPDAKIPEVSELYEASL